MNTEHLLKWCGSVVLMSAELQRLVDNVGTRLSRSVAIDDAELRLKAYNAHQTAVDAARSGSIMQRSVPRTLRDYAYECGADTATDLFDLPARPDLGVDIARIGLPVRHQNALLGFLWLLGSEGSVDAEQADVLRQACETAGLILHREHLLGELARGRERELTRDLLTGDEATCEHAAEQLITENLFVSQPVNCIVVQLSPAHEKLTDQDRLALAAGIEFGRKRLPQRHALPLERTDHAILLIAQSETLAHDPSLEFGEAIRNQVLAESSAGTACWVGVSGACQNLDNVKAAYAEARQAAEVAQIVRILGPVVHHSALGIYGLLAEMPLDRLAANIPSGLRRLLDSATTANDDLIRTLETFLDNAGEVKRTSEKLHIHRTSLYYRLKRIQETTGLSLSSGDDRLNLHLGLKIARLIEHR